LAALLPNNFLQVIPPNRLPDLPRYLKALLVRSERAALNPVKDRERSARLAPYQEALGKLQAEKPDSPGARRLIDEFRWMLEEFKVSLLAQELGTPTPVSPKRLDEHLQRIAAEF
jgi:ATP-dependent helicase HrpA